MENTLLFPFYDYWHLYAGFLVFVFAMLALDLGVFNRKDHVIGVKEATLWSIAWVCLALIFNAGLYYYSLDKFNDPMVAKQVGLEFLTGYVIEKALSIDNIFVFVVVFSFFKIPPILQHRVLFFGILGALVFRAIFIALGSILMQYQSVVVIFGVFLLFTGAKMLFAGGDDDNVDPSNNVVIKLLKKIIPVTSDLRGHSFFVRENGVLMITPLFVCLIFMEMTDVIFAVDSVPAIFAITKEPMIVFTSNIFAILGLRSLYFLLANVVDKFHLLKYGLALVLIFVGLKMVWLNKVFDGHFPIIWSLSIIFGLITVSVFASLMFPKKEKSPEQKS